jgi:hypothetical protein
VSLFISGRCFSTVSVPGVFFSTILFSAFTGCLSYLRGRMSNFLTTARRAHLGTATIVGQASSLSARRACRSGCGLTRGMFPVTGWKPVPLIPQLVVVPRCAPARRSFQPPPVFPLVSKAEGRTRNGPPLTPAFFTPQNPPPAFGHPLPSDGRGEIVRRLTRQTQTLQLAGRWVSCRHEHRSGN